jgi:hypothetical protein
MVAGGRRTRCNMPAKGQAHPIPRRVWNRRNKLETIAKPNSPEPIQISVRPSIKQEMTMIKVGSKEEVALLLALFGVLNLPLQAPKKRS